MQIRTELNAASQELQSLKHHFQQFLVNYRNIIDTSPANTKVPPVAQQARPTETVASQARQAEMPFVASQARQPQPPFVASQARQPQTPFVAPQARQAEMPFVSQLASRLQPSPAADGLLTVNVSRKMGQVGNNVTVTFSSNDKIASRKAKICGSSAKNGHFYGPGHEPISLMGCSVPLQCQLVPTYRASSM